MSWDDDKTVMKLLSDDLMRILGELDDWIADECPQDGRDASLTQRLWNVADTLKRQSESK